MDHRIGCFSPVFVWLLVLSLLFMGALHFLPFSGPGDLIGTMELASRTMAEATQMLREFRKKLDLPIDTRSDPNATGLIGLENSPITTSVGQLEAKRTTTNPNASGLVVLLLHKAGVRRGDTIAVGASGSFPALILATLCAASAMDLRALIIPSLGASQWGANDPDFHWLVMQQCLRDFDLFPIHAVAVSLGGDNDDGTNMAPEGRSVLDEAMRASGVPIIRESELQQNVTLRLQRLEEAAGEAPIRAFVNIGGSLPNIGSDSLILKVRPGLAKVRILPPPEKRGLVFAAAARGIPVLHLLFIRGLAAEYGLPWDPQPLPAPGKGLLYRRVREQSLTFVCLGSAYLLAVAFLVYLDRRRRILRPLDHR
jgi:poly-gamma-glutamate system protein